MAASVGLVLLGGFVFLWFTVTLVAAFLQEAKVGWPRFGRKLRMFWFICGMIFSGSVQQFIALPYSLVAETKKSRAFAQELLRQFFCWFAPAMWGKIQIEGLEKLPKVPCRSVAGPRRLIAVR
jgi:hypothetical protein